MFEQSAIMPEGNLNRAHENPVHSNIKMLLALFCQSPTARIAFKNTFSWLSTAARSFGPSAIFLFWIVTILPLVTVIATQDAFAQNGKVEAEVDLQYIPGKTNHEINIPGPTGLSSGDKHVALIYKSSFSSFSCRGSTSPFITKEVVFDDGISTTRDIVKKMKISNGKKVKLPIELCGPEAIGKSFVIIWDTSNYKPEGKKTEELFDAAQNHCSTTLCSTTVNIVGNQPEITISGGSAVTEGSPAEFTLTASPAPSSDLTVKLQIDDDDASSDFIAFGNEGSQTVTIKAGSKTEVYQVITVNDNKDETDGTVKATVKSGTGYTLGDPKSGTVTVNDNDPQPTVSFASASSSAVESAGTHNVTVNISSAAPSGGLTLSYSVTGTATVGSGNDFTIQNSETLTIAAGATSATIPVAINDDSSNESDETVILTLNSGTGYTVGNTAAIHTLTITDNDSATLSLSGPTIIADEGDKGTRNLVYTVSLSQTPSAKVDWKVCFAGTATADTDGGAINANADYQLRIKGSPFAGPCVKKDSVMSGQSLNSANGIKITIKGDTNHESNETVIATLSIVGTPPSDVTLGTSTHTHTIRNDDTPSLTTASFASATSSALESAGTHGVSVNLNAAAPPGGITVGYSVSGTATAGSGNDFTIQNSETLTIAAGATTATIPVVINDDSSIENDETVILTLNSGAGYTPGNTTVHTFTITDNDNTLATPTITIGGGSTVTEGGKAEFTVTANPAPSTDLVVDLRIEDDATSNFIASSGEGRKSVTISAGESIVVHHVTTVDDSIDEPNGSVKATVQPGTGYTLGTPKSAYVTVNDDDIPPVGTPIITIRGGNTVTEGGQAVFTVTASPAPLSNLVVDLRIEDDATSNFIASSDKGRKSVTINAGSTSAVYNVPTVDDSIDESNGMVKATVLTGSGYTLGNPNFANVYVNDDDTGLPRASFSQSTSSANEKAGMHTIFVTLSPAPSQSMTLNYSVGGSADENIDYNTLPGQVDVQAGAGSVGIKVMIIDDTVRDNGESIILTLDTGSGYSVGSPSSHTMVIMNEEAADMAARVSLLRYGRTMSEQVLDAVSDRLWDTRNPGFRGSIAGHDLVRGGGADREPVQLPMRNSLHGDGKPVGGSVADGRDEGRRQALTEDDLMTGTGFAMTGQGSGTNLAFWGRTARSGFDASQGMLTFDGKLSSFMIGADKDIDDMQLGLMLVHSRGKGSYSYDNENGQARVKFTSFVPYFGYNINDGLHVWGALGVGKGKLTLTSEGAGSMSADARWQMVAAGMRGVLVDPGSTLGFGLDAYADGLWTHTRSDKVANFEATSDKATRLRAGVESYWGHEFASGGILTSRANLGLRHDGGDAETGLGIEIGGGLDWTDQEKGLVVSLDGTKLLKHDDKFDSWSLAATLSYDPNPGTKKGFSTQMSRTLGGTTTGGDALLGPTVHRGEVNSTSRGDWQTEMAYGISRGNGMVGSSYMQLGGEDDIADARIGHRIEPDEHVDRNMSLDLWTEPRIDGTGDQAIGMGLNWPL